MGQEEQSRSRLEINENQLTLVGLNKKDVSNAIEYSSRIKTYSLNLVNSKCLGP